MTFIKYVKTSQNTARWVTLDSRSSESEIGLLWVVTAVILLTTRKSNSHTLPDCPVFHASLVSTSLINTVNRDQKVMNTIHLNSGNGPYRKGQFQNLIFLVINQACIWRWRGTGGPILYAKLMLNCKIPVSIIFFSSFNCYQNWLLGSTT